MRYWTQGGTLSREESPTRWSVWANPELGWVATRSFFAEVAGMGGDTWDEITADEADALIRRWATAGRFGDQGGAATGTFPTIAP